MKNKSLLNGTWNLIVDPQKKGEKESWFSPTFLNNQKYSVEKIAVPSNYNTIPKLFEYTGVVWYILELSEFPAISSKEDLFLCFDGANYIAKIWINGQFIGEHEGGFLPFKFRLPNPLKLKQPNGDKNWLVVKIDTSIVKDGIPGESTDWFNWGGLHRDVYWEIKNKIRIDHVKIKSSFNSPWPHSAQISISIKKNNFSKNLLDEHVLTCRIYELRKDNLTQIKRASQIYIQQEFSLDTRSIQQFNMDILNPKLWSPTEPNLYEIELQIKNLTSPVIERFGIRMIETQEHLLLLNKRPIKMKGASLHEELEPYGRHYSTQLRRSELQAMKALGFNALRSAHYSHDERLCQLCDEEGLLLLEEIPLYWNIEYTNRKIIKLAAQMIRDLISRDFNHPSVIVWSVGNEVPVEDLGCRQTIKLLLQYARKLDPSRLVTYASCRMVSDVTRKYSSINAINFYFGWYYMTPYNLNFFLDAMYYGTHPKTPWIMTEFGAGAKYGEHNLKEKFSEENQARTIAHQIQVMNSKPYMAGWFIWIYRDFRSSQRLNRFQQGFNRKGIVSEKNEKKLIARIMPQLINKKIERIRHYRGLAQFYAYIMRWVERVAVKIIFFLEFRKERKMVKSYYHTELD
ncbi:glycoside hydrolase family 2 protein [Candidatus Lokiarchaeum ossiferum]|uniref:glycoside hydrolase family 2 protein n=1 Tax=Candidatus Lokiarchaeum ossiferum TaxID=2951803 RepID=UPI00352FEC70